MFLRAERSGDWNLHLATIRQMVHLFAATGHTNYAKCARLYVEMTTNLPNTHPDIYGQFLSGRRVHRSNKLWTGILVDLCIEQAMMRSIKGKGGLTHKRGVSDSAKAIWISTVHKTAAMKTALANLTDTGYDHDLVQHPELGKSRANRDNADLLKLLDFFRCHNPFAGEVRLRCLTSGVAAAESDSINCDDAERVGADIVRQMNGASFKNVCLKRKDQVRTLAQVTTVSNTGSKKRIGAVDPMSFLTAFL